MAKWAAMGTTHYFAHEQDACTVTTWAARSTPYNLELHRQRASKKFAWPLAKRVSRPDINHPHLIHKSTNRFFILSLLDLSSIPRAREGAPGGPWAPKSVRRPFPNGRKPPLGAFWRLFWGRFRSFWRSWGSICFFYRFQAFPFAIFP